MIIKGLQPWARDSQMGAMDCSACGLPPASYWFKLVWHMKAGSSIPSREIGATFPSGNPRIEIKTDNGTPLPANASGVDIYVSCRVLSGAGAHGCVGSSDPQPEETLQAVDVPFPNGIWEEPSSGLGKGAHLPAEANTIDYSTGRIVVTLVSPLTKGQVLTADYINGGWMSGTGLMDEDGRHASWIGFNPICLSNSTACDGRDYPKATANSRVATDLDEWVAQFSAQYFGTLSRHLKTAAPEMLYFGADTVGTWGVPPRKEILEGAAPYVDGLFTNWFANQPNSDVAVQQYMYLTRYLGDKPLLNFMTLHAQSDSALFAYDNSRCCFGLATQQQRGQQWNSSLRTMLTLPSYNGTFQWIGIVWWGSHDFGSSEHIDWGLKTPRDNAYDGRESVAGNVACSPPMETYKCGGEDRDYGDLIDSVKEANQLWRQYGGKP